MDVNDRMEEMLRDMYNFPDDCFEMEDRKVEMWFNSDYRRPKVVRQFREFDVGGKKVMAYSRKDAIKRLKHGKG